MALKRFLRITLLSRQKARSGGRCDARMTRAADQRASKGAVAIAGGPKPMACTKKGPARSAGPFYFVRSMRAHE
jgi:hypothetical protein